MCNLAARRLLILILLLINAAKVHALEAWMVPGVKGEKEPVNKEEHDDADRECRQSDYLLNYFRKIKPKTEEAAPDKAHPLSYETYNLVLDIAEGLRDEVRRDQMRVRDIARALNAILYSISKGEEMDVFKSEVRKLTSELSEQSRRSSLYLNSHMSYLIKCDAPSLILDLTRIALEHAALPTEPDMDKYFDLPLAKEDFLKFLGQITNKYTSAKQFFFGVGMAYSYIPTIRTVNNFDIDLSIFDPTIGDNGRSSFGLPESDTSFSSFSNYSYPSLRLTADTTYVSVDLMLSDTEERAISTTSIQSRPSNGENEAVLFRTNVTSTLDLEYDAQFKISIKDSYLGLREFFSENWDNDKPNYDVNKSPLKQYLDAIDFGFSLGVTGISIENTTETEFRLKSQNGLRWEQLEVAETRRSKEENHFNLFYWNLFATFEITDQFVANIEYRSYNDDSNDGDNIDIDGKSISLSFVYFIY